MGRQDRLELGQSRVAIGIGRARLRRDPLRQRHAGVDIAGIGVDPAPQYRPGPFIGQIGEQGQGQLAQQFAAGLG